MSSCIFPSLYPSCWKTQSNIDKLKICVCMMLNMLLLNHSGTVSNFLRWRFHNTFSKKSSGEISNQILSLETIFKLFRKHLPTSQILFILFNATYGLFSCNKLVDNKIEILNYKLLNLTAIPNAMNNIYSLTFLLFMIMRKGQAYNLREGDKEENRGDWALKYIFKNWLHFQEG